MVCALFMELHHGGATSDRVKLATFTSVDEAVKVFKLLSANSAPGLRYTFKETFTEVKP